MQPTGELSHHCRYRSIVWSVQVCVLSDYRYVCLWAAHFHQLWRSLQAETGAGHTGLPELGCRLIGVCMLLSLNCINLYWFTSIIFVCMYVHVYVYRFISRLVIMLKSLGVRMLCFLLLNHPTY